MQSDQQNESANEASNETVADAASITKHSLLATYQLHASRTALKVSGGLELYERVLGLGEEVAELHRAGNIAVLLNIVESNRASRLIYESDAQREQEVWQQMDLVNDEAGDVLWYCAAICTDLGLELEQAPRAAFRISDPDIWHTKAKELTFESMYPIEHQFTFGDMSALAQTIIERRWNERLTLPKSRHVVPTLIGRAMGAMDLLIEHSGAVLGLTKKALRDGGGHMDPARAHRILGHLGMCLLQLQRFVSSYNYIVMCDITPGPLSTDDFLKKFDYALANCAARNLNKLAARAAKNTLHGEGDKR